VDFIFSALPSKPSRSEAWDPFALNRKIKLYVLVLVLYPEGIRSISGPWPPPGKTGPPRGYSTEP
jgi:hypothetical protein